MYQVIFGLALVLIICSIIMIVSYFQSKRNQSRVDRKLWIKDHLQEIIAALAKVHITVTTYDASGRQCNIQATTVGYSLSNLETGHQTRILDHDEFYGLMREAEDTKAEKLDKLLFGKYLYRQFSVK